MTPESYPLDLKSYSKSKIVHYIWSHDGWCYVPQLQRRQKYLAHKNGTMEIQVEPWFGVIPMWEHLEDVELYLFSQEPLLWAERIGVSYEIFLETKTSQSKSKKTHDHPPVEQFPL